MVAEVSEAGYCETKDFVKAFKMGVCTGSASAFSEELAKEQVMQVMDFIHLIFNLWERRDRYAYY